MTNKHMKKYSTSLVIREKQTQTNMRYHYTPTLWIKLKGHTQCWQRCAATELCMLVVGGSIKWCLIQNAHLPYDPEILLLGTDPREMKT